MRQKLEDPVCMMTAAEETEAATPDYHGEVYWFRAPGCKAAIDRDLDKYWNCEWEPHGMHGMRHEAYSICALPAPVGKQGTFDVRRGSLSTLC